jgi:CrcB protein
MILPLGTLLVNVAGSMLIGLFAGYSLTHGNVSPDSRLFFQTGVLGAFTTFSAFSLDTLLLLQQGFWRMAVASVLLNIVLCLAAVALGFGIASGLSR